MIPADTVIAAGVVALWVLAISALGLVVLAAAYAFENRHHGRKLRRSEDIYSSRCPKDLTNLYGDPR